ncbi:MAG: hypothetical protein ABW104_16845 [Candidatus Thiodiazotropha sp. 6PLUC2]
MRYRDAPGAGIEWLRGQYHARALFSVETAELLNEVTIPISDTVPKASQQLSRVYGILISDTAKNIYQFQCALKVPSNIL